MNTTLIIVTCFPVLIGIYGVFEIIYCSSWRYRWWILAGWFTFAYIGLIIYAIWGK